MLDKGVTVVLVSHDINMIKKLCTKVVWLEHGYLRDIGPTEDVCEEYEG